MPDDVVVTDSATAAEAAPAASGEAVEQTDATHGDTTDQATSTDDTAAEASTEADEDEGEESLPETATEEEKTRAQKRRERRQAREQERIDKAVQERYEQAERVREAKVATEAAEAKTKADYERSCSKVFKTPDMLTCAQAGRFMAGEGKDGMWTYLVYAEKAPAMSHELAHVALHTFERIGADPLKAEEPFCYLLQQLMIDALL